MYGKVLIVRPRIIVETCNPLLGSETGAMLPEIWGLFLDKTKKGMGQVIRMPMEANGTTEA